MNRDDIIRMALESGFSKDYSGVYFSCGGSVSDSDLTLPLKRFAALVAAHERNSAIEQCERLKWKSRKSEYLEGMDAAYENVIKWLRARGEQ